MWAGISLNEYCIPDGFWSVLRHLCCKFYNYKLSMVTPTSKNMNSADHCPNSNKTVCMVFPPSDKRKAVASAFPSFRLRGIELKFVDE